MWILTLLNLFTAKPQYLDFTCCTSHLSKEMEFFTTAKTETEENKRKIINNHSMFWLSFKLQQVAFEVLPHLSNICSNNVPSRQGTVH
jgi:hypothetical protein